RHLKGMTSGHRNKNDCCTAAVGMREMGKRKRPYDNPFVTIPGAYHTLFVKTIYMRGSYYEQR
ncbi:MAG: hypothetical protein J6T47_07755, partial [Lachnospiraceae bacterium]|nr:hypothetical protein [Lachnospiraceae bacterium]